ncbi:MAG: hypothetical protein QOH36_313 [Actinomycetota bacterium]|nr:hypothetical protein [Actinomycetota bacterium]
MDLTAADVDLRGWTPIRVAWRDGRPLVDWCHTEGVEFTDPFFGETVQRCLRHPFRLLFRHETTIEGVGRHVAEHPGLPPAGFIFHMSRCGSTLVSQMLAAVPEHLVLSEPGPVDSVLRAREMLPDLADDARCDWLRWMIGALGQGNGGQTRLYVKFDAWSATELPLVRRAFPDVPWLFLFRDPVEVLVSQSRQLGAHVIPGVLPAETFGMSPATAAGIPLVDYSARVLAHICEAALEWEDDPLATFADYADLPELVFSDLVPAWSLTPSEPDLARMAEAAGRDAKNPCVAYDRSEARRRAAPSPAVEAAAEQWLRPVYERLLSARTVVGGGRGR